METGNIEKENIKYPDAKDLRIPHSWHYIMSYKPPGYRQLMALQIVPKLSEYVPELLEES